MVLCNIECVNRISEYLDISPGKLYVSENNTVATDDLIKNQSTEGFSTIVQTLVKNSKYPAILGDDAITQALTRQMLEYAVLCVNYADNSNNEKRVLKELNYVLKFSTYVAGTKKTIADVTLYYALHGIMQRLSLQEKAEYVHLSRWFDNMQQDDKLRQTMDVISFNMMHLYL
ncbi:eukaryotic translation elongation factor 1 epsilon-1-like isoform X1 [Copidosoma floridanum]|uniref:eukaryotic translation elongation factor 1 epsilon-1-like isoform X1 n=1 Tax=Copidosoma floridanum TaxID=29053 RepID=UPI0006C993BB|nr:eukaryotic translation elongation factor 1 epsilon-1-like isoform X1 [Copidosoma floridanum]XP_014212535.1 eukaryotic translation elongation factor 1 epsilon-1-like isoform X1 [Copidosoma floridanum]